MKYFTLSILIAAIFLMSSSRAYGQEKTEEIETEKGVIKTQTPVSIPTAISVGYYANYLTHSGMKLGYTIPVRGIEKIKERTRKNGKVWTKTRIRSLLVSGNIGFYVQDESHTNLFLTAELTRRNSRKDGLFLQHGIGLGYIRTFYHGKTYEVLDDVLEESKASQGGLMPAFFAGFGYDFSLRKKGKAKPIQLILQSGLFAQLPYNSAFIIRNNFEFKVSYLF